MKIKGITLETPNIKVIPIVRESGNIYLKAAALTSFDEFEKLCPTPEPPMRQYPGKPPVPNFESSEYKKALLVRQKAMVDYMVIKSLLATDGLEWETVDLADPSTWENYVQELMRSGFSAFEVTRIIQAVHAANSLDEEAIEKAREAFLAGQQVTPGQG